MVETLEARQRVLNYKEEKNISYEELALMSGYKRQEIQASLTGKIKTPRANEIILTLIKMFGLA